MNGPAKPPRLPTALISAIAPAAARPLKNVVDRPQNGAIVLQRQDTASESATNASTAGTGKLASKSPNAAHQSAVATCHRRSPRRSDDRPWSIIAKIANSGGIALSTPTNAELAPGTARLISVGKKKSSP